MGKDQTKNKLGEITAGEAKRFNDACLTKMFQDVKFIKLDFNFFRELILLYVIRYHVEDTFSIW
ncbi:hypothetical protein GCM10007968_07320 [Sporolactobacillus putidus]|uniref:Uncharacterized protein n=1 Tax=Sporolactobacillus putidus TaxID=492735 RepID=A0A917RZV6_9BACL|nr:hypothetical protein GCM10007968_07320 [Sporolactobacillus putidus]